MTPQKPFKDNYIQTQGYADNFNNYPERHHGALDLLPLDKDGKGFPALIYPLFNGSEVAYYNTDVKKGKGVRESLTLDKDFIDYLKGKGVVPKNFTGRVDLEVLYWHVLEVLDTDGTVTQDTPIAKTGNTGDVYHNGVKVPDSEKGKPPYLGLHLHLETLLRGDGNLLNLDKDVRGRIDPHIILDYKGKYMNDHVKIINYKGTVFIGVGAEDIPQAVALGKAFGREVQVSTDGKEITNADIKVD